ncbi:hypothetical protein ABMA27_014435 [Loxostege sticticalis]|uniref:Paired domain-containing protein n=1 Tax=Loxostege sticticalis TaxID=481309 RepID=A0ABR3I907_LOXSC
MVQEGRSQRSTARTVGVSLSTVQRVLQRFQETGMNIRRPGNGRPRCTTVQEDRFIVSTMLRNRHLTSRLFRSEPEIAFKKFTTTM